QDPLERLVGVVVQDRGPSHRPAHLFRPGAPHRASCRRNEGCCRLNDGFPEVGGRLVGFKDDVSDALLSQTLQSLPFTPRRGTGVALAEVPEVRHTALSSCSWTG